MGLGKTRMKNSSADMTKTVTVLKIWLSSVRQHERFSSQLKVVYLFTGERATVREGKGANGNEPKRRAPWSEYRALWVHGGFCLLAAVSESEKGGWFVGLQASESQDGRQGSSNSQWSSVGSLFGPGKGYWKQEDRDVSAQDREDSETNI